MVLAIIVAGFDHGKSQTRKGRAMTMRNLTLRWLFSFLFSLTFVSAPGFTQTETEPIEDSEYGSTYARVRFIEGEATLQRTQDGEIVEAAVNDPL